MEEKKEVSKRRNPASNFLNNLKNVKRNYKIVSASPYASLKFRYSIQRLMVFLLSGLFVYSFWGIISKYQGGSSLMTLMGRIIMLSILVILIYKTFQSLDPIKRSLAYYEGTQHAVVSDERKDVKADIDSILNKYTNNNDQKEVQNNEYSKQTEEEDRESTSTPATTTSSGTNTTNTADKGINTNIN